MQQNCPWIAQLLQAGHSKNDISRAIDALPVQYSPIELQEWAGNYDIVAVQEADMSFRTSVGDAISSSAIFGQNDVDARGIEVEAYTALAFPRGGVKTLRQERTKLVVGRRRGVPAARDHVAVLVERESDGQQVVFCSVHLHPSSMIRQGTTSYLQYLRPLQRAIERAALIPGSEGSQGLQVPCFLVGDFNDDPDGFRSRTGADPFWSQFELAVPEGGDTAHSSNPAVRGDFAICAGGAWRGRCLGSTDFGAFERHAGRVVHAADQYVRLDKELSAAQQQVASASGAKLASWQRQERRLRRELEQLLARQLRRSILSSDHRPLSFTGIPAQPGGNVESPQEELEELETVAR